ncbi:MAG: hypothetical protein JW730_06470 [Anaerolineales bacterium]|nr:hypothetical protein [Anaerolineales bacterium]
MPQLVKGGKWVFGWSVVGPNGEAAIPPAAFDEYGFQPGEPVILLRGSQRSGGVGVARRETLAQSQIPLSKRALGEGRIDKDKRVIFPPQAGFREGERLLVARGSGLALGFVQRGPIYEEAVRHPEIEVFSE